MMGQSLSTAAVSGKSYSPSADALAALSAGDIESLLEASKRRWGKGFFMEKGKEDDDSDEDDDDASGDDDDDSNEDDDGDDDDDESEKNPRVKELSDENAKWRTKNRRKAERIAELEKELAEAKKGSGVKKDKKDGDEDEGKDGAATQRVTELESENTSLKESLEALRIQMAFVQNTKYNWKNPKTALRLADLSEVTIDEDGDVEGLDEALKKLAEDEPYLLVDDSDDGDDDKQKKSTPTGRPPKRGSKSKTPDRKALEKKYPALARL